MASVEYERVLEIYLTVQATLFMKPFEEAKRTTSSAASSKLSHA